MSRTPATMPETTLPIQPAGLGPDSQPGDMNTQSQINPLASADAGGTAGHDVMACVSARGKCDGASVCDARDARVPFPTTLPLQARQVVAPQAQNFGTGAAAIALVPQPSTIENAGADPSKVSISKCSSKFDATPSLNDNEGWTVCQGKAALGQARRSAERGPSDPSVLPAVPSAAAPSVRPSVRLSAGVTSLDAVAPSVTLPSVPSASLPLLPWGSLSYNRSATLIPPSVRSVRSVRFAVAPSVAPSVALPAPFAGGTPGNAASPVVYSVFPATIPQTSLTNDSLLPAGAAAASTNDPKSISADESTSKINNLKRISSIPTSTDKSTFENPGALFNPSNAAVDRLIKSGIKLTAAAGTKARPAKSTIFTDDTSSNPGLSTTKGKRSKKRLREKKKKNLPTDDGIKAPPVLAPNTDHAIPTAEEGRAYMESRLELLPYQVYDGPNVITAQEDRAYKRAQRLQKTGCFHPTYIFAIGPEAAPTPGGSEPFTSTPHTRSPRQPTPPTPRMSRLAKEAAKNARNTQHPEGG